MMYKSRKMNFLFRCFVALVTLYGFLHTSNAGKQERSSGEEESRPKRQLRGYFAPSGGRSIGWGPWGPWSMCTRSCGGGIAVQIRTCYRGRSIPGMRLSRPTCTGPYKRYRSCNSFACFGRAHDIPSTICSSYNKKLFSGKTYIWEPFNTGNFCKLNCRAQGHRFYLRHSTKDTDGIRCVPDPPSEPSPIHPRHICVNGQCLKLGCNMVINSGLTIDRCGVCGGNGASCEVVEGLFRRENLNLGYNFVVRIPAGTTRINITELSKSMNYLALNSSNARGSNYINGNWGELNPSKKYRIPGTYVDYKRPMEGDIGESMIIPGPTKESMDVWLFFQRNNPGISYQYTIPKPKSSEFDQISHNYRPPNRPAISSSVDQSRNLLDVNGASYDPSSNMYNHQSPNRMNLGRYPPLSPNGYSLPRTSMTNGDSYFPRSSYPLRPVHHPQRPTNPFANKLNGHTNRNRAHSDSVEADYRDNTKVPSLIPPVNDRVSSPDHDLPATGGSREQTNPRREISIVNIQKPLREAVENKDNHGKLAVESVIIARPPPTPSGSEEPEDKTNTIESVRWWRDGFSECSRSCAEGLQTVLIKCIKRRTKETVDDQYCSDLPRPGLIVRKCNRAACPAYYDVGAWSECSRTCGVGRRSRRVVCRQQFAGNFTSVVTHKRCRKLQKPLAHERCKIQECAGWAVKGDWSECSVQCGNGKQTREVACMAGDKTIIPEANCARSRRPSGIQSCRRDPCLTAWFYTDWGTCTSDCDSGVQKREVYCLNTANNPNGCASQQPTATRTCARASCGDKHEWFSGPWGPCSTDCGTGKQERSITCMRLSPDGGMTIADSRELCSSEDQPATQQTCNTQSCGSRWFYMSWSVCTASCGGGTKDREVWCLDAEGKSSNLCKQSEKPTYQERCNTEPCHTLVDPKCSDKLRGCRMVLQAGLCSYPYYRVSCCHTCSRMRSTHLMTGKGR